MGTPTGRSTEATGADRPIGDRVNDSHTCYKEIPKAERRMLELHVLQADGPVLACLVFSLTGGSALSWGVSSALFPEGGLRIVTTAILAGLLTAALYRWTVQPRLERAVERLRNR